MIGEGRKMGENLRNAEGSKESTDGGVETSGGRGAELREYVRTMPVEVQFKFEADRRRFERMVVPGRRR